jgi:hypothetical protein
VRQYSCVKLAWKASVFEVQMEVQQQQQAFAKPWSLEGV